MNATAKLAVCGEKTVAGTVGDQSPLMVRITTKFIVGEFRSFVSCSLLRLNQTSSNRPKRPSFCGWIAGPSGVMAPRDESMSSGSVRERSDIRGRP